MTTKAQDALADARENATAIRLNAKKALEAHVDGDGTATRRHLRAVLAAHSELQDAHDKIARALPDDGYQDPTSAAGAQTSNGQAPRDYSPEAIRLRDQRAACEAAYRRRIALEGTRR